MARMRVDQLGELLEDFDHLVGALAARHHDDHVGVGLLRNGVLEHGLARSERPRDKARTTLGHRVEGVDRTHAGLHDARRAGFLRIAAHGLLHGPFLHHRHLVVAAFGVGQDCHRVGDLVFARLGDALDRIAVRHREGNHDLVHHPLLLHLAQPRRRRDLVADLGQRRKFPLDIVVDRIGDRTAGDEQTVHLFEVVLKTVVVARQKARSQRDFEHVTLEFDPVADLQTAGAVKNLDIGRVAYDLDDLGHHFGIARPDIADLVLTHGSVGLDDHDVGDDTVYTSCSFHCMFLLFIPY